MSYVCSQYVANFKILVLVALALDQIASAGHLRGVKPVLIMYLKRQIERKDTKVCEGSDWGVAEVARRIICGMH